MYFWDLIWKKKERFKFGFGLKIIWQDELAGNSWNCAIINCTITASEASMSVITYLRAERQHDCFGNIWTNYLVTSWHVRAAFNDPCQFYHAIEGCPKNRGLGRMSKVWYSISNVLIWVWKITRLCFYRMHHSASSRLICFIEM